MKNLGNWAFLTIASPVGWDEPFFQAMRIKNVSKINVFSIFHMGWLRHDC
jgi:hypothetical protein